MTQPILQEANGKRLLLVEVMFESEDIQVHLPADEIPYIDYCYNDEEWYYCYDCQNLPTGSWQIIGLGTADKLTPGDMRKIC